ncbi:NAD-dependent protein deacetylase [Brachybacterium saurashtrense]|uniref:protein acetyllysine N-acetyltransferase n=1 Tax=Brachybacterium saurashtrense TaxID=556288 RepID=A0A345YR05_9MICO|nr:NAD-dependent protein deacetylase [Brachybacterium saurashtrense]AXK46357.1 NAD-dependent protein deacetylase [Brachybacterium saurashtrense]RRR24097.1 NAD-dependent protein deacetylase [Brachybacterium saurashtrense]
MSRAEDHPSPVGPAADVGRWFSTATRRPPDAPGPTRGGPRLPAWGPMAGAQYGLRSDDAHIDAALAQLRGRPVAVLTGAGMSTGSGLPDYRGRDAVPRSPMTYQEFLGHDLARRRYWARSTVGWEQFRSARPGTAHRLLAALHPAAFEVTAVITQNVDGLHAEAGSEPVIDLHGRLDRVRCQQCDALSSRAALHQRMLSMNPALAARLPELAADAAQAPDGDAEVDRTSSFRYPPCALCGGILKPDVVFFGESARREVVAAAFTALARAEALLVLGSSLTVQSGLRFVRAARREGKPVVILNDGPTRADPEATVRVHGRLEDVLAQWAPAAAPARARPRAQAPG